MHRAVLAGFLDSPTLVGPRSSVPLSRCCTACSGAPPLNKFRIPYLYSFEAPVVNPAQTSSKHACLLAQTSKSTRRTPVSLSLIFRANDGDSDAPPQGSKVFGAHERRRLCSQVCSHLHDTLFLQPEVEICNVARLDHNQVPTKLGLYRPMHLAHRILGLVEHGLVFLGRNPREIRPSATKWCTSWKRLAPAAVATCVLTGLSLPVSTRLKTTSSNSFAMTPGANLPSLPPRADDGQVEYLDAASAKSHVPEAISFLILSASASVLTRTCDARLPEMGVHRQSSNRQQAVRIRSGDSTRWFAHRFLATESSPYSRTPS